MAITLKQARNLLGRVVLVAAALAVLLCDVAEADPAVRSFTAYNFLSRQGANSTSGYNTVQTARPNVAQPLQFGDGYTFDMPLLAEKSLSSTLIGRVQGTYAFVQQTGGKVFVTETFEIFNGASVGGLNGTFSAVGTEFIGQNSTKPIVGGTGDFTFNVGIAETHPLDATFDSNGNLNLWFMYKFTFKKI